MAPDTISRASIKTGPNAELVQFNDVRLGCIGIWGAKIGGKRAMSVCHHSPHLTRHHIYVYLWWPEFAACTSSRKHTVATLVLVRSHSHSLPTASRTGLLACASATREYPHDTLDWEFCKGTCLKHLRHYMKISCTHPDLAKLLQYRIIRRLNSFSSSV